MPGLSPVAQDAVVPGRIGHSVQQNRANGCFKDVQAGVMAIARGLPACVRNCAAIGQTAVVAAARAYQGRANAAAVVIRLS